MCLSVPAEVISFSEGDPLLRSGKVSFGGILKEINFAFLPEAKVGDFVLVHVGFAISLIDRERAENVFSTLKELADLVAQEDQSQELK